MTPEEIAPIVHECIRGYQRALGEVVILPWENTSHDMRESTISGVRLALEDGRPEVNHENWLKTRTEQGWVHGSVKDFAKKTHPLMVPYEELPEAQKAKDKIVIALARILAEV